MAHSSNSTPPPQFSQPKLVPVLYKIKTVYSCWSSFYPKMPKVYRYTLAQKVDNLFVELIEMTASASFLNKGDKLPYLRTAIRKLDTLKIMLIILWENHSIDAKKYELLSVPLEEIGRMLGGWLGQVEKQNSPNK